MGQTSIGVDNPKIAVTLAMALHELMTNAAKYGALSVAEGQVAVRWSLADMDDGRQRLDLRWEERGGPAVTPPPPAKGSARG